MTEQEMKQMAEEYTKNYISSLKIVAEKAFVDGMKAMYKEMTDKLSEL